MLSNNTNAFFELVRAGLWEKDVQLSQFGSVDYNTVYRIAEEQSVIGLVAAGIEHVKDVKIPQEFTLQYVGQTLQMERRNTAMNHFIEVLIDRMRSAGIYTLLVKGQAIAQCYERPLWRACGDVDLFLSKDNYEKAKRLLLPLASSQEKENVDTLHLGMIVNDWNVELHGTLHCGLSHRIDKVLDIVKEDVFDGGYVRTWMAGDTQVFLLRQDEDVVYVFTHFLQHFYRGGVGLRQICDWCRLVCMYHTKIDLVLLEKRLRAMNLITEWKAFSAFAVLWLGMPRGKMPLYSNERKWIRKANKICSFILKVGNFGHNRDMSFYSKKPYFIQKFRSFIRRNFDLINHVGIFPLDSFRFFPKIIIDGIRSAARGE